MENSISMSAGDVWHITWEYPPQHSGGLGVACAGLVDALTQWGEKPRVLTPSMMDDYSESNHPPAYDHCGLPRVEAEELLQVMLAGERVSGQVSSHPVVAFSRWVLSQLANGKPRVLHAHDWQAMVVGVAIQRALGIPLLAHIHSTHVERVGEHVSDSLFELEKWGLQQADVVVAVSRMTMEVLHKNYGVATDKLRVVTNGHAVSASSQLRSRDLNPVEKRRVDILWVGRLCAQKDPVFMLEVFQALKARVPGASLRMVGSGECSQLLQKLIDFKGLRSSVQLFPMLEHEKVMELFEDAKILCVSSRAEPFGLVALEAAGAGCHCVLSSACGAAEVLPSATVLPLDELNAWVEQLELLLRYPRFLQHSQEALHKEAASATWEDAAEKCRVIYCELLDGKT